MALPVIGSVLSAAGNLVKSGFSAVFGGITPKNKKDPERIRCAQNSLERALLGDPSGLADLEQHSVHSATAVGREAHQRALVEYRRIMASGVTPATIPQIGVNPPPLTPLQQEVARAAQEVRNTLADSVNRVGTQATSQVATNIAGQGPGSASFASLPFRYGGGLDQTQMALLIGGGLIIAMLAMRRR